MSPTRPTAPKRKKPKPRAGVRDRLTHQSEIETFQRRWPGFRQQSIEHQLALIRAMRHAITRARRHKADPDAFHYHYKEIENDFGRGEFEALNELLRMFEISPNWSLANGETRRYWLTPNAERILLDSLGSKRRGRLGKLLDSSGRTVTTLPEAVAAKDVNGITAKVWRGESVPRLVPVSMLVLNRVVAKMASDRGDLFMPAEPQALHDRWLAAADLRKMATTSVAGRGLVAHRYQETGTGRLSAIGPTNLQSAPRTVRKAALEGFWDYDFDNCHYTIIEDMAARYGCICPVIRYYLDNKQAVRDTIANDIGAEIKQVKRGLIAVIYGARASASHYVALYEAMGNSKGRTRRLLRHPLFIALHRDVKVARNAILSGWPVRRRRLINEAGKGVSVDAKKEQRMAHLAQGAEAIILRTALRQYSDKIVLLVHDGFVTTEPVDTALIEDAVLAETGYVMKLTGERIVMPADFDVSKTESALFVRLHNHLHPI